MVSADKVDAVWIAKLEADEEGDCFDTEETAVYIVAWFMVLEGMILNLRTGIGGEQQLQGAAEEKHSPRKR